MVLPLAACSVGGSGGGTSIPRKGLQKYQDQLIQSYGSDTVVFSTVSYAYITGDGNLDAGSLKGNVYYKIPYKIKYNGTLSSQYTTFVTYYSSSDYVVEDAKSGATAYQYAVELIQDGSLKGTTGTL